MGPSRANALLVVLLAVLVAGLAVLATLQYRWIDQVSDAERIRMQASLEYSARRLGGELMTEIDDVHLALTARPPGTQNVIAHYYDWLRRAAHPSLVEALFVAELQSGGSWRLQKLDDRGDLTSVEWPRELEPVRRRLQFDRFGPPLMAEIPALLLPPRRGPAPPPRPNDDESPDERAVIVMLSRAELANTVLPELVHRYFATDGEASDEVALASRTDIVYSSTEGWPKAGEPPDVEIQLTLGGRRNDPDPERRFEPDRRPMKEGGSPAWRLLVRRRDGGLAPLVAAARRRNLAISFGIFVILATTILMLLYLLRRADRLRSQQTEFVAAISHELNTPVAALRSAGENLKDGIITDRARLAKYGETIVREASRLGDMIGQVLEFAGMQARPGRTIEEPVDVGAVVEEAVAQSRWIVDSTTVEVETHTAPNLPQPIGDPRALTRAVQNLIANAIRHGGSGGWVGIRASRDGRGRIRITVEDRGPGIDGRDAGHLFEPFYRGRRAGSVRGSGLGLTIVKQIVTAHGGTIEIERRRTGAAFIIHLPVGDHV